MYMHLMKKNVSHAQDEVLEEKELDAEQAQQLFASWARLWC